jgi:hypothetical protein
MVEGVQAGDTEEIAEDTEPDGLLLLPPPHAVRQRSTEDMTKPHAS